MKESKRAVRKINLNDVRKVGGGKLSPIIFEFLADISPQPGGPVRGQIVMFHNLRATDG